MNLSQDFEKAVAAYESHSAYATLNCKKEVWTSGHYFNLEPFDFERGGFQRSTLLNKKPASTKQKYCYLFGEDDVLLAVKQGLSIADQFNEEFLFWEDGLLKSCLYGNNKVLINVKARVLRNNQISEVFLLGKRGSKHETYFYQAQVLTRVRVEQWNAQQQGIPYNAVLTYEDGQLVGIVNEFDNGYKESRYLAKL